MKSVFFFLLFPVVGAAQEIVPADTSVVARSLSDQVLTEVRVTASRSQYYAGDTKVVEVDTRLLEASKGDNLGKTLMLRTPYNVKANGAGGLTTLSLRGASTSHTQVNWNGFPINSMTLGSCDLSQIPAGGFSHVSLVLGASGALYGSGTFGGAVNLDNDLAFNKNVSANINYGYNSLITHLLGADFHASGQKVAYQINGWSNSSDNQFEYYDYVKGRKRTQNDGGWDDKGIIQNIAFKIAQKQTLEVGMWWEDKDYHIPSRIGSQTYEFQSDSALRVYARYKHAGENGGLVVKAASFFNHQYYWSKTDPNVPKSIESTIDGRFNSIDANYRHYFGALSADAGVIVTHQQANVSAYKTNSSDTQMPEEITATFFGGLKYSGKKWGGTFTYRFEANDGFDPQNLFGAGTSYKINNDDWKLRANVSSKYRNPTFNDRYWVPGGNLDLKPESGFTSEVGHFYRLPNTKNSWAFESDLSLYFSLIDQMIVWQPDGAFWRPMNYQKVQSSGADVDLKAHYAHNKFRYATVFCATINRSVVLQTSDNSVALEGQTLSYSPRITTTWSHYAEYGKVGLDVYHKFTSDRFDSSRQLLPPFQLLGASLTGKLVIKKCLVTVIGEVDNILGQTYELVTLYPMPGRTYSVKINVSI